MNHGRPKHISISNTLLPIELDIAIPPLPLRVIMIEETTSGKLVPIK